MRRLRIRSFVAAALAVAALAACAPAGDAQPGSDKALAQSVRAHLAKTSPAARRGALRFHGTIGADDSLICICGGRVCDSRGVCTEICTPPECAD
jgi:hypothetical protein